MLRYARVGLALVASCVLVSCGGGGGGGGGGSTPAPAPGTPAPIATPPAAGISVSATPQQGSYWEFAVNTETNSFAQGSSPTASTDFGIFRVTLGAPMTIGGATVHPVSVSGTTTVGNTNYRPRWTHIGFRNGSVVGSTDGATLQSIYDATTATALSRGFFITFGATESVTPTIGSIAGEYNTFTAVRAAHSTSSGGCETILGIVLCNDSSTSFSEQEFYADGVGPIGYERNISFSSSGGNFFTSTQIRHTIEIVGSSLTPADGSTIRPAPWLELAPMPTARTQLTASTFNNEIYVFGGVGPGSANLSTVDIYNPATDTWRSGVSAPVGLAFYKAQTVDNRTYLFNASVPVRIFDHATNTWSTGATAAFADAYFEPDVWRDTVQGRTFIFVVTAKLFTNLSVHAYEPASNQWFVGAALPTTDHRHFSARVIGDALYLTAGFRQSLNTAFNGTYRFNFLSNTWTTTGLGTLQIARYNTAAAVLNGSMYLLGGNKVDQSILRDMEAYNVSTGTWSTQPKMLRARRMHAAVALNGKIYVLGGDNDGDSTPLARMDVYTP